MKKTQITEEVIEAFNKYEIEYEEQLLWDHFLFETEVSYDNYQKGDIVFVKKYDYLDGTEGKNHLFVIIEIENKNVYGMLLSSKIEKISFISNQLVRKNERNGLKKDSILKTDVKYRIPKTQILFRIGSMLLDEISEL